MNTNWQAPQNFIQVNSTLSGISVYAPREDQSSPGKLEVYACPNCGATTQYDVAAGGVACEHCGYQKATKTENVGKLAAEQEFNVETIQKVSQIKWVGDRKNLVCDQCGAITSIPQTAISSSCSFCASNKIHYASIQIEELQPKFIIPFNIEAVRLSNIASAWLGAGWFHPKRLSTSAAVSHFSGIYLPFWTFDADIDSDWKALVGYERSERYYDASSKEWKTRTTIHWQWEKGNVSRQFDDLMVPGTRKVSQRILEQIQPFDLNSLKSFSSDFLAGWQAHHFDLPLEDAWNIAKHKMREESRESCYLDIPSSHIRNFSMSADFANESWRYIFLPVFISTYRFDEKTYQIMVNGQTGEIAGQKPVEWWKIWAAIAASLSPGLLLLLIGLLLMLVGGIGIFPLILGFIFLVLGIIFSVSIYRKAIESEAA